MYDGQSSGGGRIVVARATLPDVGAPDAEPRLRAHMAERRLEGLERVHGVGALFSAAYGNVGSSIYYALGVTAAFALGLTPVAFVISGLIFASPPPPTPRRP